MTLANFAWGGTALGRPRRPARPSKGDGTGAQDAASQLVASEDERNAAALPATLAAGLLDFLLPPACLACRRPIASAGNLCPACWRALHFIDRPYCEVLGVPFAYELGPGARSAEALARPPAYDRARAAVLYGATAGTLVHALKYRDRLETAAFMGRTMCFAGRDLFAQCDILVPVPLHFRRLRARRYNQSAILATEISRKMRLPVSLRALRRIRPTRQQVGLDLAGRESNVRGAFRVVERAAIAGRRVILVDDVLTSGATIEACARALRHAGAKTVDALVFARVAGDAAEPI